MKEHQKYYKTFLSDKKIVWIIICSVFFIIVIYPMMSLLIKSFLSAGAIISQLQEVYSSKRVLNLILNSLSISLGTAVISLLLGLPTGFFLSRCEIIGKKVLKYLVFLPLIIPLHISTIAWMYLFNPKGMFNFGLLNIYSKIGCIFIMSVSYYPFIVLLIMVGLASIDRSQEEQAKIISGTKTTLLRITFPLIYPFIVAGFLFVFILSLINYSVPSMLRINTYPIEIFAQFSAFYNHELAALLAVPLLVITMVMVLLLYWLVYKKSFISINGNWKKHDIISLGSYNWIASGYVWCVVIISGIIPLISLMMSANNLRSYAVAFKTSLIPLRTSLFLSISAATLSVLIALVITQIISREETYIKKIGNLITILPLSFPPTVLGVATILVWNTKLTQVIYATPIVIIFVFIASYIPFAVRIIQNQYLQIDKNINEAAELSGAGYFARLWKITIPLTKKSLFIAWSIVFVFCMGEIGASVLVIPAGYETLSTKIYALMHYGVGKMTSALSLILIVSTFITIAIIGGFFMKEKKYDFS